MSNPIPADFKELVDSETFARLISRISYEIVERNRSMQHLAIVGIRTCGEHIARRIHAKIEQIEKTTVNFGVIDITLYRDDLSHQASQPTVKGTQLPFSVSGTKIILVDDVLFTGRTVRSALDAIIDFGRPSCVELAVLVDRGHRELPIRADYVGKNIPTSKTDFVRVCMTECNDASDGVFLSGKGE